MGSLRASSALKQPSSIEPDPKILLPGEEDNRLLTPCGCQPVVVLRLQPSCGTQVDDVKAFYPDGVAVIESI